MSILVRVRKCRKGIQAPFHCYTVGAHSIPPKTPKKVNHGVLSLVGAHCLESEFVGPETAKGRLAEKRRELKRCFHSSTVRYSFVRMKMQHRLITISAICFNAHLAAQNPNEIQAGITNPSNNEILTPKTDSEINEDGDYEMDGWSNTGNVSRIDVYVNGSRDGSASGANSGTWSREVEFSAGVNEVYINVRCNFSGCSLNGIDSATRYVVFVEPPSPGEISIESSSSGVSLDWGRFYDWNSQTGSSATFTPYYRVYRSLTDSLAAATPLTSWTANLGEFTDSTGVVGQEYFYFVEVATSSSGQNASGFDGSGRRATRTAQLSIDISSLDFTGEGSSENVTVTSNTTWSVSSQPDWMSSQLNGSALTLTAEANEGLAERSGIVTLSTSGGTPLIRMISVSQGFSLTDALVERVLDVVVSIEGGVACIELTGLASVEYEIQYSLNSTLREEDWRRLPGQVPFMGDGSRVTVKDTIFGNTSNFDSVFYRVVGEILN